MLREVLPSDVDFAHGMIGSGHSDAEILACLASRGIEPPKAAQLVDDLRHGRKPSWEIPAFMAAGATRTSGPPRRVAGTAPHKVNTPHGRPHRRIHRRRGATWWLLILVIIFAWACGYAFLHLGSDASQDVIQKARHEMPPAPNK